MHREIKFRGIWEEEKKFIYGDLLKGYNFYSERCGVFDYKIAIVKDSKLYGEIKPETVGQYTGLKDSKGKEIYEGDILEVVDNGFFDSTKIGDVGQVIFQECKFFFYNRLAHDLHNNLIGYKIIGNIHENPELLNGQL